MEQQGRQLTASGTQLGAGYELRYRLEPLTLSLDLVGERSAEIELDNADFFDLGWSPLFNSLPVIRDGLLHSATPRDYLMRWVDVPSLELSQSRQRYEPLGDARVRFRSASSRVGAGGCRRRGCDRRGSPGTWRGPSRA